MRLQLHLCLTILLSIMMIDANHLFAQAKTKFTYGPNDAYNGSLSASLVMIGKDKRSGAFKTKVLTSKDPYIDIQQYQDISIVLRISNFKLEDNHLDNSWMELPLNAYLSKNTPGLEKLSKTQVLVLGGENIRGARKIGDIRYGIMNGLTDQTSGEIGFSFDFISSEHDDKKIRFKHSFPYVITATLPIANFSSSSGLSSIIPLDAKFSLSI
ncbi:MAG: hypothetical protein AAFO07_25040, partial [Bacteroidota bacterium]